VIAFARFLHHQCWLHLLWTAGHSHLCVSRPNRVRLRCGSHVRLSRCFISWDYSLPTPGRLHVNEQLHGGHFQSTRSARFFWRTRDRRDLISWNNQKPTHSAFSFKNPLDFINLSLNIKSVFLSDGYFRFCQRGRNHDLYPCFESWGSWCEEPG